MKNPFTFLIRPFKRVRCWMRYAEAVSQADAAHISDGDRYYVVPFNHGGRLMVVNRHNFRLLKRKGYISTKKSMQDVQHGAFYYTANRAGVGMDEATKKEREQLYYSLHS